MKFGNEREYSFFLAGTELSRVNEPVVYLKIQKHIALYKINTNQ